MSVAQFALANCIQGMPTCTMGGRTRKDDKQEQYNDSRRRGAYLDAANINVSNADIEEADGVVRIGLAVMPGRASLSHAERRGETRS